VDTPRLLRRGLRGHSEVEPIDVGGWNGDDLLVEVLVERTLAALSELECE
jgi:hypothetical protein